MSGLVKKIAAVLAVGVLCAQMALAEGFMDNLPEISPDNLSGKSLTAAISVNIEEHEPFDENRNADLQAICNHVAFGVTIRQDGDNSWSQGDFLIDGNNALSFTQEISGSLQTASFSFLPETIYTSRGSEDLITEIWNGENPEIPLIFPALMNNWAGDISDAIVQFADESGVKPKSSSTNDTIRLMGTAKKKQIYSFPASMSEEIPQLLASYAANPEVASFFAGLTFSGKQSLTLFRSSSGNVLQLNYTGKCCGRNVTLKWRMRRDDKVRDSISLTSPALSGSDKNTLTVTMEQLEKDGVPTLSCEWSHKWTLDKATTTDSGTIFLTVKAKDGGKLIQGQMSLSQIAPGSSTTSKTELTPEILLSEDETTVFLEGKIGVSQYSGKNLLEKAEITLSRYEPAMPVYDTLMQEIELDNMSEEELAELSQNIAAEAASVIVRELVKLPREDTMFISRDIPDETWDTIVENANR